MIPRGRTAQLDLFAAPAPVTAPAEGHPDEAIVEQLIADGHADRYSVALGYHPRDPLHPERPAPWDVPSRLFQFPYRFHRLAGESTRVRIKHAALRGHPHIAFLAERTGFPVEVDPRDQEVGAWQHAIDLCNDANWRTLLDLRRFTTSPAIAAAAAVALRSPGLALANARLVLAAIDCPEPLDRSASILTGVRRDEHQDARGGVMRPINLFPADRDRLPPGWQAWLLVHGREDRVFTFRGDHLEWNPKHVGWVR